MFWFDKALEASVMSTHLLIRANLPKHKLLHAHKIAVAFEERYSAYKESSFLNTTNQQAGKVPIPITPQDYILFKLCIDASIQTQGIFDISIGSLSHGAYHFGFSNQTLANTETIQKQKSLVNYRDIVLTKSSIFLKKKGMRLDLGGIGKGYVAREIAQYLASEGASHILVDVGGEIVTRGKAYTIAIQDPFSPKHRVIIQTSKADTSISTSGDYERFIGSPEHHHILDKERGTASSYYSSMTLMQNSWNIASLDAYATALFNQAPHVLSTFAKENKLSVLAIDKQNQMIEENIGNIVLKSLQFL